MPVATINPVKLSLKRTEVWPRPREWREVQDDPDENEPEEEVADPVRFQSAKKGTRLPGSGGNLASTTQSSPLMIVLVHLLSQFGGAIYDRAHFRFYKHFSDGAEKRMKQMFYKFMIQLQGRSVACFHPPPRLLSPPQLQ